MRVGQRLEPAPLVLQPLEDEPVRLLVGHEPAVDLVPAGVLERAVRGDGVHERQAVLLGDGVIVRPERRGHVDEAGALFRRHERSRHDDRALTFLRQRHDLERPQVLLSHQLAPVVAGHALRRSERLPADVHVPRAVRRHDVARPVHDVFAVLEVRMHRDGDVGEQRPGRRGPDHEPAVGIARERERDEHRVGLHLLVPERELVRRERRAAARAVRQDLVTAVQQRLLVQPLQEPPHRLDILVGVGDVGVLVVEPVADPLRQRLPIGLVGEDALAAQPVELLDAVGLDLLLARDAERLLDLDLDGEAVRVPPGDARHPLSQHGVVAAHHVLDGAREHVVDAGAPVSGGRPLEEDEGGPVAGGVLRLLEQPLVLPRREQLLLEPVRRQLRVERREGHQFRRSSTPRTSALSRGSAVRATAMMRSSETGASASGRH